MGTQSTMDEKHLPRNPTRMQGATYRIKICLLWVGTAVMAMYLYSISTTSLSDGTRGKNQQLSSTMASI
jgi:hypothetical protein